MGVALHPEGVDRNDWLEEFIQAREVVALHPEGVDRNDQVARACDYPSDSRPPPGGRG